MGELCPDKIDLYLIQEFKRGQDKYIPEEVGVTEENRPDNALPAHSLQVESQPIFHLC